jgi:3-hydroxyacyl-[acyl-carrier-protein] dehydratase
MTQFAFEFSVPADHPSLAGHFPGRPIVPGVLLLDHVLRGVRDRTHCTIAAVPRVKFVSPLLPQEVAHAQCTHEASRVSFQVSTQRAGASALLAEGVCSLAPEAAP